MPEVDIPLFTGVYRNIDESVANDENYRLVDGILERQGPSISTRPGLSLKATGTSGAAYDGMLYVDSLNATFAVSNGNLYKYDSSFTETNLSSSGVTISPGVRPSLAFDGSVVLAAAGGQIMYTNGTAATAFIADADAPTNVKKFILFEGYLIAIVEDSDTFYFSELNDYSDWSALGFATAGSKPDVTNAILKLRDEFLLFGRESTELWQNDAQSPLSRVVGGAFEIGCIAPNSPIEVDNEAVWLSDDRRFVKFAGGEIQRIGTQYDKDIDGYGVVSDCYSIRYDILGKTLVAFQFPSEGKTLVYNMTDDNWCEFGYWNSAKGEHEAFLATCATRLPDSGEIIIGTRRADGKILSFSTDYFDDNGNEIRLVSKTGHISFGSNTKKRADGMMFRAERGRIEDSSEPVMTLRFKDDDKEWDNERQISLGKQGERTNIVRLYRLGSFRTRQMEFSCSDPIRCTFSDAKMNIEPLSR